MDGLEWKRSKYSPRVQKFLKYSEKIAIKYSNTLIADSLGIQEHLKKTYSVDSEYIAYGVQTDNDYDDSVLEELVITSGEYNMLIARIEPENNIETILDGVVSSEKDQPFLVIGNVNNSFGKYLINKFDKNPNVRFIGAIYNLPKLNSLRKNSNFYFHGHSAGGTNPSLLEAMASFAFVCAHDNIFNRSILDKNAFYFSDKNDVKIILDSKNKKDYQNFISNNYERVITEFNWDKINKQYEDLI
jgi:glycosyltransferase involved in cell wall biosynthesis